MKILVLNGSPKKEKSDTMHITRAFLDGMKETAAQEIHPINVTDRHIEFCRGCFACKYNGGHCVLEGSNVLSQEQFEQDGGTGEVASWCNTVTVRSVHPNTTVAFRVNNLSGSVSDLTLYAYGADGKLQLVSAELWKITDENGEAVVELADGTLYELRVTVADGGALDRSEAEREISISVVLGK